MEIYVAYIYYILMMEMVEQCIKYIAAKVNGTMDAQIGFVISKVLLLHCIAS